jgi:arylsulfatase A-like enzyme
MGVGVAASVGAILCGFAVSCSRTATPPRRYNVLLLSLDTVRQDVVGAYGHRPRRRPDLSPTPNLDRLAAQGVRMVDAIAPSPWTLPSHLSLLTGLLPLIHGVETEVGTLAPSTPTLATILKAQGYRTAGVFSAPYLEPHWGFDRGFDAYRAVYGPDVEQASARSAALRAEIDRATEGSDWARYDALKRTAVEHTGALNRASEIAVTSEAVADAVIAHLRTFTTAGEPWFVFGHFFDAHCDYVPPSPYDRMFDPDYVGTATGTGCLAGDWVAEGDPDRPGGVIRRISDRDLEHVRALYEGEVAWVDSQVGRILEALEELDAARTTLVVVVSDHGEEFFEHGGLGHRRNLAPEAIRIPLLLRLPDRLPAGAAPRGAASLTDVLPTVMELLGLPHQASPGASSLVGLIQGTVSPADSAAMARLVVMFGGEVQVDDRTTLSLRQIMVQDAFQQGTIKVTRSRRWPQFPAHLPTDLQTRLGPLAEREYAAEDLWWTDIATDPSEPDTAQVRSRDDPRARRTVAAFHDLYAEAMTRRHVAHAKVPVNMRERLESLGYVQTASSPAFPEPDVVLPPPAR